MTGLLRLVTVATLGVLLVSGCAGTPHAGTWADEEGATQLTLNTDGTATFTDFPVWPVGDCDAEPMYVSGEGEWTVDDDLIDVTPSSELHQGVPTSMESLVVLATGGLLHPWSDVAVTPPCSLGSEFMVLQEFD